MDRQTTMNGAADGETPVQGLARDAAGMAHDMLGIVELQCQLFADDCRLFTRGMARAAAALVLALALLLAALPTALSGAGLWMATALDVSPASGLLLAALLAMVLTACCVAAGIWQLRRQLASFDRSRREFNENIALLKRMLANASVRSTSAEGAPTN
jgi:hypothetical protein